MTNVLHILARSNVWVEEEEQEEEMEKLEKDDGEEEKKKQRRKRRRSVILKTRARGIRLDEGRVALDSWAQPGTAGRAGRNAFYANSSMDLDILSVYVGKPRFKIRRQFYTS